MSEQQLELSLESEPKAKTFEVTWVIDIEATTPTEAARIARRIQLDPNSEAVVFCVQEEDKKVTIVDLI